MHYLYFKSGSFIYAADILMQLGDGVVIVPSEVVPILDEDNVLLPASEQPVGFPDGLTQDEDGNWQVSIDLIKADSLQRLSEDKAEWLAQGAPIDALGSVHYYKVDTSTAVNMQAHIQTMQARNEQQGFWSCSSVVGDFTSIDNYQRRPHTLEQLQQVLATASVWAEDVIRAFADKKQRVREATTIDEIEEILNE